LRLETGSPIKSFNNYSGGGGSWETEVNQGPTERVVQFDSSFKLGPPDASKPWHPNSGAKFYDSDDEKIYSYGGQPEAVRLTIKLI
jgi:hypothetical protein